MVIIEIDALLFWTILSGLGGAATFLAYIIKIAQNKQRKKLWIALGAIVVLVLLLVLLWPKLHPEDNSKIQQEQVPLEQIQTQQVAQNQPQPQQPAQQQDGAEAKRKEDEDYRKCTTISGCDSYLRTYPHGRYEDKVRQKRSELVEDEAYKKCMTISDCQEYLVKYPDGCYASEVRRKLEQMEQKQVQLQTQQQSQSQSQTQTQQQTQSQFQSQTQTQQQTTQNTPIGSNGGGSTSTTCTANGHDYVDLGLPSGTLWATCNVGANKPEDYGDYFAWGETSAKSTYNWSTYKYANGDIDKLTKYCNNSRYGNNGYTDNLTTLQTSDDAATAKWGSGWRTPNKAQWEELLNNTTRKWTTKNGKKGCLFTSKKNGSSIFLPAAGYRAHGEFYLVESVGGCWARTLNTDRSSLDDAWNLYFHSDECGMTYFGRDSGWSVRPVREK